MRHVAQGGPARSCCRPIHAPPRSRHASRPSASSWTAPATWRPAATPRRSAMHGAPALSQPHCHQQAVLGTAADARVLARNGIPVGTTLSGCCGLAGNFGAERGHEAISRQVAELALVPALAGRGPGRRSSWRTGSAAGPRSRRSRADVPGISRRSSPSGSTAREPPPASPDDLAQRPGPGHPAAHPDLGIGARRHRGHQRQPAGLGWSAMAGGRLLRGRRGRRGRHHERRTARGQLRRLRCHGPRVVDDQRGRAAGGHAHRSARPARPDGHRTLRRRSVGVRDHRTRATARRRGAHAAVGAGHRGRAVPARGWRAAPGRPAARRRGGRAPRGRRRAARGARLQRPRAGLLRGRRCARLARGPAPRDVRGGHRPDARAAGGPGRPRRGHGRLSRR